LASAEARIKSRHIFKFTMRLKITSYYYGIYYNM